MEKTIFSIILVMYYVLSYCQSIPCVIKLIRTKKSNDYSLLNRLLQYSALICWTVYLGGTINWAESWYLFAIGIGDVLVLGFENALVLKYYKWK